MNNVVIHSGNFQNFCEGMEKNLIAPTGSSLPSGARSDRPLSCITQRPIHVRHFSHIHVISYWTNLMDTFSIFRASPAFWMTARPVAARARPTCGALLQLFHHCFLVF
jgi:hypothetical protein